MLPVPTRARTAALSGSSLHAAQIWRCVGTGGGQDVSLQRAWRHGSASVPAAYRPVDDELSGGSTPSAESRGCHRGGCQGKGTQMWLVNGP